MSDCKPNEKSAINEPDLTSISSILNILLGVFSLMQKPTTPIPPQLLLVGKNLRPGMSARNLAARAISRLETEAGIPMGDVFADGPNKEAYKIKINAEEFVAMVQTEASVSVHIGADDLAAAMVNPSSLGLTGRGIVT